MPRGVVSYVRRAEIEAFSDASPSNCILILTDGEDDRAFQKCSSIAAELKDKHLVSFPNKFGMAYLSPPFIDDLRSTNDSGRRLNLRNRKHISVTQSCALVNGALPHE
jgi:hypothetical protein